VGIGDTTFAAGKLQVYDSSGNHVWLKGRAGDGTSSVSFRNNADNTYNGRIEVADTGGMLFQVAGETRATIDASGRALFGHTAAIQGTKVEISAVGDGGALALFGRASDNAAYIGFYQNGVTTRTALIQANNAAGLQFISGSGGTAQMALDASGNLLVGDSVNTTNSKLIIGGATRWAVGTQSGGNLFYIVRDSDGVGQYMVNGGTSWTATSDERLKDIIEPITDAANKVSTLRAVIGKFKKDAEGTRRSFLIAQDVQTVLPEAVTVQEDEVGTLGIQYTEIIPLLVAAIKEQQSMITSLTARIEALEGAN